MKNLAIELKEITANAIARNEEVKKRTGLKVQQIGEQRFKDAEIRADRIMKVFTKKAKNAANRGENSVRLLSLEYSDFKNNIRPLEPNLETVRSCSITVLQTKLKDIGIETEFEEWHDGVGIKGGIYLNAKW